MNQGKKKAEIHANRCQNGDMHKDVKIKRDVTPYLTSSYVMEMFFYISMFNPFDYFFCHEDQIHAIKKQPRHKYTRDQAE